MALLSIVITIGSLLSAALIYESVVLIKRQIKICNSISLVELKSAKIHYFIFLFFIGFFIIYTVFQMVDASSPEIALLNQRLNLARWQANLALSFLLLLLVSAETLFVLLVRAKSAVVDRGIYTSLKYLEWYDVHDYIIDEEKGVVVLSSDKDTFSTIRKTTPPLKVAKNDIPKLKFILNKNKNKFSGFQGGNKV